MKVYYVPDVKLGALVLNMKILTRVITWIKYNNVPKTACTYKIKKAMCYKLYSITLGK